MNIPIRTTHSLPTQFSFHSFLFRQIHTSLVKYLHRIHISISLQCETHWNCSNIAWVKINEFLCYFLYMKSFGTNISEPLVTVPNIGQSHCVWPVTRHIHEHKLFLLNCTVWILWSTVGQVSCFVCVFRSVEIITNLHIYIFCEHHL